MKKTSARRSESVIFQGDYISRYIINNNKRICLVKKEIINEIKELYWKEEVIGWHGIGAHCLNFQKYILWFRKRSKFMEFGEISDNIQFKNIFSWLHLCKFPEILINFLRVLQIFLEFCSRNEDNFVGFKKDNPFTMFQFSHKHVFWKIMITLLRFQEVYIRLWLCVWLHLFQVQK